MQRFSFIIGFVLILVGGLLLADNLGFIDFRWGTFWPWLVIAAGLFVCYSWFKERSRRGMLLPGITLLVYGCLFLYCANYGWWRMDYDNLWAFFLIGPGLGFLATYAIGNRERALLIPGILFTGLGTLFWFGAENMRYIWPLGLIILGFELIRRGRRKMKSPEIVSDAIIVEPTAKKEGD